MWFMSGKLLAVRSDFRESGSLGRKLLWDFVFVGGYIKEPHVKWHFRNDNSWHKLDGRGGFLFNSSDSHVIGCQLKTFYIFLSFYWRVIYLNHYFVLVYLFPSEEMVLKLEPECSARLILPRPIYVNNSCQFLLLNILWIHPLLSVFLPQP